MKVPTFCVAPSSSPLQGVYIRRRGFLGGIHSVTMRTLYGLVGQAKTFHSVQLCVLLANTQGFDDVLIKTISICGRAKIVCCLDVCEYL